MIEALYPDDLKLKLKCSNLFAMSGGEKPV